MQRFEASWNLIESKNWKNRKFYVLVFLQLNQFLFLPKSRKILKVFFSECCYLKQVTFTSDSELERIEFEAFTKVFISSQRNLSINITLVLYLFFKKIDFVERKKKKTLLYWCIKLCPLILVSNSVKKIIHHRKFINISFMPKHKDNKVMFIKLILKVNVNPKL